MDILTLWADYRAKPNEAHRNRLVEYYLPSVEGHARRLMMQRPQHTIELDDLVSLGVMGLMEAIPRFDPARNIKFETFAKRRIIGAMVDGLRRADHLTRSDRAKVKRVREMAESTTLEELAAHMKCTAARAAHLQRLACDDRPCQQDAIDPKPRPGAVAELKDTWCHLTRGLTPFESVLLKLCVLEEMSLTQASRVCGYSVARASQVMRGLKDRLHDRLQEAA